LLGYSLLLLAILRAMQPVLGQSPAPPVVTFWVCIVIAALYAATMIGRPALGATGTGADLERALRTVTSLSASVAIATLVIQDVRPTAVTLALGLEGAVLLAVGFPLRERVLRLSGLTLLLFCILKLFVHDLAQLEALARILSFVVLGLVLLAVSWSYTRFREQIRKFL
jgi:hypothetical protein